MQRARIHPLALAAGLVVFVCSPPIAAEQAPAKGDAGPARARQPASPQAGASRVPALDVALLAPPKPLEQALRAALSPWGMRIEVVVRDAPVATLPGTALHAAALARELDAKALVWVSANADGAALWVYEASKGTITARPIPDEPLDRALSAALALSVKTWLRSPEPDIEAAPPSAAEPAPPAPAAPAPVSAPPPAAEARRDATPRPLDGGRWQLVIFAAARRAAFEQTGFEPRYGVEVRTSPGASDSAATGWSLGARVEIGGARELANSSFRGTYSELGAGISLGIGRRLADPLRVAFHIGAALHRGSVWGTLLSDRSPAESAEWGAAAQLRPEAELSLGSIGVLFQPTVGVSILGERYRADGELLLETRPVWWMLGGGLRAKIF